MPSPARLLLGPTRTRRAAALWLGLALACFCTTFTAYAIGVFHIAGCVVFIPGQAAGVALLVAFAVGSARGGLVPAWGVAIASLLGFHADHAFSGLASRPVGDRLAYFLELDGLAVYTIEGVVLGSLAWLVGRGCRWVVVQVRERSGIGTAGLD